MKNKVQMPEALHAMLTSKVSGEVYNDLLAYLDDVYSSAVKTGIKMGPDDSDLKNQYDDGYEVGHDVGYDRGYDDAEANLGREINQAWQSGYDEGYEVGLRDGQDDY